jgi:hypothetical protein
MNKNLLIIGGILNLFASIFHAMFWKLYGWPENLLCLSHDDQARIQVLTILLMLVFAFFAYVSLFHRKAMLSTSLGRRIAWFIVIFYFVRMVNQLVFWDAFLAKSILIMAGCIILILIYIIPLISSRIIQNDKFKYNCEL